MKTLHCLKKQTVLLKCCDPTILASRFNQFYVDKIEQIRAEFSILEQSLPSYYFGTMNSIYQHVHCTTIEGFFRQISSFLLFA